MIEAAHLFCALRHRARIDLSHVRLKSARCELRVGASRTLHGTALAIKPRAPRRFSTVHTMRRSAYSRFGGGNIRDGPGRVVLRLICIGESTRIIVGFDVSDDAGRGQAVND